jgi:DnaJ-domain-containing protein 1
MTASDLSRILAELEPLESVRFTKNEFEKSFFPSMQKMRDRGYNLSPKQEAALLRMYLRHTGKDFHASGGKSSGQSNSTRYDAYQILGVKKGATADEIKKAYHNLIGKYHPDRLPASEAIIGNMISAEVNAAYNYLR